VNRNSESLRPGFRLRLVSSLGAGALLPLAFAPYDQFWIAPLSYAVLFYLWGDLAPRRGFWIGVAYGLGSFGTGTYWTYIAIHDFGGAPIAMAVAVSFALMFAMALFIGAAGFVAARWLKTSGPLAWLGTLPALWVLTEWLRGWLFTGFGWLAAGYSQTDSMLMAYAPLLGIYGMSWAVLLLAGSIVSLAAGPTRARVAAAVTIGAVAAVGFAAGRHAWTEPKERDLRVALVQGAVQQDLKWRPDLLPGTKALYFGLTQQHADADLIVWPEAAIPDLYERNAEFLGDVRAWSQRSDSAVLLGILRRPPEGAAATATFQNVLVALTDPPVTYVKRHLVPFGEYYPVPGFVRNWLKVLDLPYSDGVPGARDQPALDAAGERIAVTICYEDVFGAEQLHYLPDATLLVNVSNDAWFGDSIAPHQHLQIAQVRAAEAGRYLLRSTNTGVTAVIDPKGRVTATIPQFEAAVLTQTVRGYTGATPYARWGNYPVIAAALLILVVQLPPMTKFRIRPRT
jgi:apolipoprotein N-acyltransferase